MTIPLQANDSYVKAVEFLIDTHEKILIAKHSSFIVTSMDLHDFRTNYSLGKLSKSDLSADPITQFNVWLKQTIDTGLKDPNAMIVATVDEHGQPSQRYVLLKKVDEHGFVFFTDTSSVKGQQIAQNSQVSLLFPWHQYERQVRVQGVAEPLSNDEVEEYFHSRPLGSQLAAAASQQSQAIDSRDELLKRFTELKSNTPEQVELPERWGGYCIKPTQIEFWQVNGEWQGVQRLQP